ncbi:MULTISPECIES: hypothetical protein [unclassified Clostridium]|uniref:hypothetical protein n=1 Tax=unclassified Clostridium TaxID=2614128 RepID=UPI003F9028D3
MKREFMSSFNELTEIKLNEINGGGPIIGTIALAGGVIAAANEVYKFGKGYVDGYNGK